MHVPGILPHSPRFPPKRWLSRQQRSLVREAAVAVAPSRRRRCRHYGGTFTASRRRRLSAATGSEFICKGMACSVRPTFPYIKTKLPRHSIGYFTTGTLLIRSPHDDSQLPQARLSRLPNRNKWPGGWLLFSRAWN